MDSALIGTIIGALAALSGGVVGAWIQYYFNKKKQLYENKKEAYITTMRLVSQLLGKTDLGNLRNDLVNASILINLYGTKEIIIAFEKTFTSFLSSEECKEVFISKVRSANDEHQITTLENLIKADLNK